MVRQESPFDIHSFIRHIGYIRFNHAPFHHNEVVNDAVVIDLAEDDTVIGIELISPSRYVEDVSEIVYRYTAKDSSAAVSVSSHIA